MCGFYPYLHVPPKPLLSGHSAQGEKERIAFGVLTRSGVGPLALQVGDVNEGRIKTSFVKEWAAQLNLAGVTYRLRRLELSFVHPTRPQ